MCIFARDILRRSICADWLCELRLMSNPYVNSYAILMQQYNDK